MNIILYLLNIIQYQYKIIGQLLTLSVNTFLSSSGLLTIHTLQSIKNSKSTNYQKSFPTSRIGIVHYIYREFKIDFFRMDLNSPSKNASSLRFSKFDQNVMGLCLSYKVNLGLSLHKTAHALHEIHGIKISHQQVANYLKTAAICVKPFVDNYNYQVKTFLLPMRHTSKSVESKGTFGLSWTLQNVQSSVIRYLITMALVHASCPCVWLSNT